MLASCWPLDLAALASSWPLASLPLAGLLLASCWPLGCLLASKGQLLLDSQKLFGRLLNGLGSSFHEENSLASSRLLARLLLASSWLLLASCRLPRQSILPEHSARAARQSTPPEHPARASRQSTPPELVSCWPLAGLLLASCWPLASFFLASCWPLAGFPARASRQKLGFSKGPQNW